MCPAKRKRDHAIGRDDDLAVELGILPDGNLQRVARLQRLALRERTVSHPRRTNSTRTKSTRIAIPHSTLRFAVIDSVYP